MAPPINPILLQIGPVSIYWYGVLVVTGIILGTNVADYLAKVVGEDPERVWDMLLAAVFLGIIGARIEYVLTPPHWDYYRANLLQVLYIWQGGLRIYGAAVGGALGIGIYAATQHINTLRLLDFAAPGMALGHAIGRWGNFINRELYGPPTTLPWGLDIPTTYRIGSYIDLTQYPESTRFHPAFLYESLANLLLCLLLMGLFLKLRNYLKEGDIVIGYLVGYSIIRYFMDFLRTDSTSAQSLALIIIALGILILLSRHVFFKKLRPRAAS
ncbi:MAG: prolipoprotein diacylglyceryl transferase [Anaerolineae bacterium]|nr:prolipoprotein diacylglyceryl transferase [Anaerolineae bacterium]